MMANATDGTSIQVASATDQVLVYDATDSTAKQVNVSQLPFASVGLVLALVNGLLALRLGLRMAE